MNTTIDVRHCVQPGVGRQVQYMACCTWAIKCDCTNAPDSVAQGCLRPGMSVWVPINAGACVCVCTLCISPPYSSFFLGGVGGGPVHGLLQVGHEVGRRQRCRQCRKRVREAMRGRRKGGSRNKRACLRNGMHVLPDHMAPMWPAAPKAGRSFVETVCKAPLYSIGYAFRTWGEQQAGESGTEK